MLDFDKHDDVTKIYRYEGFIDKDGYFYKVCKRGEKLTDANGKVRDSHNSWAEQFMKEKLKVKELKIKPTESLLFALTRLSSPAEVLVNCYGFVYYSHEPIYYKPIIKIPNPRIANHKITSEQLDTLFSIMTLNKEDTNIPLFFSEEDDFEFCGNDENKVYKKIR